MDPINNEPICYLTGGCTLEEMLPYLPEQGVQDGETNMLIRTRNITFESLYKNIATLPHTVDITNKQYVIKKYYLTETKIITITVDSRMTNRVLTTISGEGIVNNLIKTTVKKDNIYYVTYHQE